MGINIIGLGHVSFYVDDLEKAKKFYTEALGFEQICVSLGESDGSTMCFFANGDVTLELVGFETPPHRRDGLIDHLCLRVGDIELARKQLESYGVVFDSPIEHDADIYPNGGLFQIFRGPCGERLQLEQRL